MLNGHRFLPSNSVPDAFVNTYMRTGVGAGWTIGLEQEIRGLDGEVLGTFDSDIAFLSLGYEFQQAFGRIVALRIGFVGAARLGTNEAAILAQGVTGLYGLGLGATVRVLESEKVFVSATADLNSRQGYFISPLDFVRDVIDNGLDGREDNLVRDGSTSTFSVGGRVAYSPNPWWGLVGVGELGWADPFEERDGSQGLVTLGGKIGFDVGAGTSVPLGIQTTVRFTNFAEGGSDIAEETITWGGGLWYTGRDDFAVGLEGTYQRLNVREGSDDINSMQLRISLRYFF
jgi:hypothetical protein